MKKLFILGFLSLFFAACGGPPQYVKPGATEANLEAAKSECQNQILTGRSGRELALAGVSSSARGRHARTSTAMSMARHDMDSSCKEKAGPRRRTPEGEYIRSLGVLK